MLTATQPDWQAQLAADPAHAAWSDARQAEDQRAFDHWLDSPEGTLGWRRRSKPRKPAATRMAGPNRIRAGPGKGRPGERTMIQLHPRMTLVTAAYFLRLSGYRLRWNIKSRSLEIVEL